MEKTIEKTHNEDKEEKKMEDKKQMNASEAVYGFASWLTCRKNTVCFSSTDDAGIAADLVSEFCSANALPEISDNWPNNLVHPEDKNDWHERGEFPPVGTVCRMRFDTSTTYKLVTITYVGDGVMCYLDENGMECAATTNDVEFQPAQAERQRLIEEATNLIDSEEGSVSLSAICAIEILVNAGMLKMPEDK